MKKHYAVVLMPGVEKRFPTAMQAYLTNGENGSYYLLETRIAPNNQYFNLELAPIEKSAFAIELKIRHEFVAYTVVSANLNGIGFTATTPR